MTTEPSDTSTDTMDSTQLETRLTFYEREVAELRETLDIHQRQILALEQRCDSMLERLAQLAEQAAESGQAEERPPHY